MAFADLLNRNSVQHDLWGVQVLNPYNKRSVHPLEIANEPIYKKIRYLTDQEINGLFQRTLILSFWVSVGSFAYLNGELFA